MTPPLTSFRSTLPMIGWPGIPSPAAGQLLSILFQLEQSQWWSPEQLRIKQHEQLQKVLEFACRTLPFYRDRFDEAGLQPAEAATPDGWQRVPLLTRSQLQSAGPSIVSDAIPRSHGAVGQVTTSGSTGRPVVVSKSSVEHLFWAAITLRDHLWHQRDLGETLATIRYMKPEEALPPHGAVRSSWSKKTADVFPTGPGCVLNIRSSLEQQVDWLQRIDPAYLLTYPSIVAGLVDFCAEHSIELPSLREVRTFGEVLEPQTRNRCREVLGVRVVDLYSSEEVGYIGLQCPDTDNYHVQSESVLVEILDERGRPCQPGETGRVVVSSLHNFASPLIRYEIGDYAEVGPPCPCGRGLPTLGRILGRKRNLLTLPSGELRWPSFSENDRPLELPPFQQFQLVQTRPDHITIRVVRPTPFSDEEKRVVEGHLSRNLGYAFAYSYEYVESIERSPTGKFEEFRSEIAVASDRH